MSWLHQDARNFSSTRRRMLFKAFLLNFVIAASVSDANLLPSEPVAENLPFADLFGEELAELLLPDGLQRYMKRKVDEIHRDLAREMMGYEFRQSQKRFEQSRYRRQTVETTAPPTGTYGSDGGSNGTSHTVYPLDLAPPPGASAGSLPGYCSPSVANLVRLDATRCILVAGCSGTEARAVLYLLDMDSLERNGTAVSVLRTVPLKTASPQISCSYLRGRWLFIVFGYEGLLRTDLYIVDLDAPEMPDGYEYYVQPITAYGHVSSCVMFERSGTLSLVTTASHITVGSQRVWTTASTCHEWNRSYMDETCKFETVAARHVSVTRFKNRIFIGVAQSHDAYENVDGGKLLVFEMTSNGQLNSSPELLVRGAVQSHGVVLSNYFVVFCATLDGNQRVFVWAIDRLLDFHDFGNKTGDEGSVAVEFDTAYGWNHFVDSYGRVVALVATNSGIYSTLQAGTSGSFVAFGRIRLGEPVFNSIASMELVSWGDSVILAVNGEVAAPALGGTGRQAAVYKLDIPAAPVAGGTKTVENELLQCLNQLETLLADKLPQLEGLKTEVSQNCIPNDGTADLTAKKIHVHDGDAVVLGTATAYSVEVQDGVDNEQDYAKPATESQLDAAITKLGSRVQLLAEEVDKVPVVQRKPSNGTGVTTVEIATLTMTLEESTKMSVNDQSMSRIMTKALTKSGDQAISGSYLIKEVVLKNMVIKDEIPLNKNPFGDYVKTDEHNVINGRWTFVGAGHFSQGVKLAPGTTINGIDPCELCLSDKPANFRLPQFIDQGTLEDNMEAKTVNGMDLSEEAEYYLRTDVPNQKMGSNATYHCVQVQQGNMEARTISGCPVDALKHIATTDEAGTLQISSNVRFTGQVLVKGNTQVTGDVRVDTTGDLSSFPGNVTVKHLLVDDLGVRGGINGIPCSDFVDTKSNQTITANLRLEEARFKDLTLTYGATIDSLDPTRNYDLQVQSSLPSLTLTEDTEIGILELRGGANITTINGGGVDAAIENCLRTDSSGFIEILRAKKVTIEDKMDIDWDLYLNSRSWGDYWRADAAAGPQVVTAPVTMPKVSMMHVTTPWGVHFGPCHISAELAADIVTVDPSDPKAVVTIAGDKQFEAMKVGQNLSAQFINGKRMDDWLRPDNDLYKGAEYHCDSIEVYGDAKIYDHFKFQFINEYNFVDTCENAVYYKTENGTVQNITTPVIFAEYLEVKNLTVDVLNDLLDVRQTLKEAVTLDTPQNVPPTLIANAVHFKGKLDCKEVNGMKDFANFLKYEVIKKSDVEAGREITPKVTLASAEVQGNVFTRLFDDVDVQEIVPKLLSLTKAQTVRCRNAHFPNKLSIETLDVMKINDYNAEELLFADSPTVVGPTTNVFVNGSVRVAGPLHVYGGKMYGELVGDLEGCNLVELYETLASRTTSQDPSLLENLQRATNIVVTKNCTFQEPFAAAGPYGKEVDVMAKVRNAVLRTDQNPTIRGRVTVNGPLTVDNLECPIINGVDLWEALHETAWKTDGSNSLGSAGPIHSDSRQMTVGKLVVNGHFEGRINDRPLEDLLSSLVPTAGDDRVVITTPVTFLEDLNCTHAYAMSGLGDAKSVDDFVRDDDKRYIPGVVHVNGSLHVADAHVDVVDGILMDDFLDGYLTRDGVNQPCGHPQELGNNVEIDVLCAGTVNGLRVADLATAADDKLEVSTLEVDGGVTLAGNATVGTLNNQPYPEFTATKVKQTDGSLNATGDLTIAGHMEPGEEAAIQVRGSLNGISVEDHKREVNDLLTVGPFKMQEARKGLDALGKELQAKSQAIAKAKSAPVKMKFDDYKSYKQLKGIVEIPQRDGLGQKTPRIGAFVRDPTDAECRSRETVWLDFDPRSLDLISPAGQRAPGRIYAHLDEDDPLRAFKVSTNLEVDLAKARDTRPCPHDPNDQFHSLKTVVQRETPPEDANKKYFETSALDLDRGWIIGDVKFFTWNGVQHAVVGYSYNYTAGPVGSSRAYLAIYKFDPVSNTFTLAPQRILAKGLVSIAYLKTENFLYLALCERYDSYEKNEKIMSQIFYMGTNDTEFKLLWEFETQYCAEVAAVTTDGGRTPTVVYTESQRDTSHEGAARGTAPKVLSFGRYGNDPDGPVAVPNPDPAGDGGSARHPNFTFVHQSLNGAHDVTRMEPFVFCGSTFLATISYRKNKCIIFQDKGMLGLAYFQTIPLTSRPTAIAVIQNEKEVLLFVALETDGVRLYKARCV